MILTVIQHAPQIPLDRFAEWFSDLPHPPKINLVRAWQGDQVPTVDECGDGLLVLGGFGNAHDDEATPWLPAVRDLLAQAVEAELPTLGICLGLQLLAVATGGQVQVGAPPGRETGVIDVRLRPEADTDPLMSVLVGQWGRSVRMPSMHADAVVTLPPGAQWLAASRQYPYQAVRFGAAAWGVQFHPEASEQTLALWADALDDVDTAEVVAEVREHAEELSSAGRALAARFADLAAGAGVSQLAG